MFLLSCLCDPLKGTAYYFECSIETQDETFFFPMLNKRKSLHNMKWRLNLKELIYMKYVNFDPQVNPSYIRLHVAF